MPQANFMQTAYNAGIYSPLLDGHMDAPRRAASVKDSVNMAPLPQGPLTRRGGTKMVWPVKDSTKLTKLIPFRFNQRQKFQIEMGDGYLRFFKDYAIATLANVNVTGVTNANPAVVTANAHGFSNGQRVVLNNIGGMPRLNGREFIVAGVTTNTFQLQGINTTSNYGAYTSGGTVARIYEVSTPYTQSLMFDSENLFQVGRAQVGDVVYLCHTTIRPRALVRLSDTNWALNTLVMNDGPYLNTNKTTRTLTLSGGVYTPGSPVTVALSNADAVNNGSGFLATDVGRLIRMQNGSNWGWLEITSFTNATVVGATVRGTVTLSATATANWRLGAWSDTTGWPSLVWVFEDKLFFAGIPNQIGRIYSTEVGGYSPTNLFMSPTAVDGVVNADNAITASTPNADEVVWIADDEKGLAIGTEGTEGTLRASSLDEAITASNARARPSTKRGGAKIRPLAVSNATLFVQAGRKKLCELAYNYQFDGFRSPQMDLMASHLTAKKIFRLAWQREPFPCAWMAMDDGSLVGFTYDKENLIYAWHRHQLGGVSDAQGTAPIVEDVEVIPSQDGTRDELWLIVRRRVNGQTVRYIEYMTDIFALDGKLEDAFHCDCGLTYSGSATNIVYGLEHLEGQSVKLLVDGKTHPDRTVTNGAVTLANSLTGSKIQIGLGSGWRVRMMKIEAGAADGVAQGRRKEFMHLVFRLLNTLGLKYGMALEDEEVFSDYSLFSSTPKLFSGDTDPLPWPEGMETDGELLLGHDGVLPATLLAHIALARTNTD